MNFKKLTIVVILTLLVGFAALYATRGKSQLHRSSKAIAMWEMRCKSAGENISKVIEDVEGFYLMKLPTPMEDFGDQYRLDDPFTRKDVSVDVLLEPRKLKTEKPFVYVREKNVYRYLEAKDPSDGNLYRFYAHIDEPRSADPKHLQGDEKFVIEKSPIAAPTSKYGLTYDDISTREDKENWISGSSLKIIDLETNALIAERIGYMVDPGQGAKAAGRGPWAVAIGMACPSFPRDPGGHPFTGYQVRDFVGKVLKPKVN